MKRLVIDTATQACSVALFDDDVCVAAQHEVIGRGHAERLVPMIANLPDKGRAQSICVNVGPGSFTGIRVGISAARALALAWQAECSGYGCLDLVAAIARSSRPEIDALDVVMIGGHGEYFVASYGAGQSYDAAVASLPIEIAVQQLRAPVIVGDAAAAFVEARGWGEALPVFPDAKYWPFIAQASALPPTPRYGRGADAKLPGGRAP